MWQPEESRPRMLVNPFRPVVSVETRVLPERRRSARPQRAMRWAFRRWATCTALGVATGDERRQRIAGVPLQISLALCR
jgi:hypothetical protein